MLLVIIILIAVFIFGFFVGRNNPSLAAVNKLLGAGKAVIDLTSKTIKRL